MIAMNGHQAINEAQELSPKQAQAIEELVSGKTIVATAKKLNLNESTIRRWQKQPHFAKVYQQAKDNLFHQVLLGLEVQAMSTLQKHLQAQVDVTAASQIKAVAIILTLKLEREELAVIMGKIATLEQIQQQGDDLYS